MKGFASAEHAYRKMTEIRPEEPQGYTALAQHLVQDSRKVVEAKAMAEKAVQLQPIAENYGLLALICDRAGDRAGCLAAIGRALELDPQNVQYQQLLERTKQEN